MKYQSSSYRVGMGLHPSHYSYLEQRPATEVAWFAASSEKYLDSRGRALETLQQVRQDYPLALHGSGMNLGNAEGLHLDYLKKLRELIEQVEPFVVSDHVAWTGTSHHHLHDLLPLPHNEETLQVLARNIDLAQSQLKTALALENIASYVSYRSDDMSEWEFISELTCRTGCNLVLDLSAVMTNAHNHHFDPLKYLEHIPMDRVVQVNLAGPIKQGGSLYNTKATDVPNIVWELFKQVAPRIRHLPIAIEREQNIPEFSDLEMDVIKASFILENSYEVERSTELV
ncbi:MAG: DUF692 domain-containing protein [Bdellovibrio sp.]|nr:DUF692 domain-containing protein [Bdellovibrio sp.]